MQKHNKKIKCLQKTKIVVILQTQNLFIKKIDMENLVENLKKYFETTSREQVLKDWEETIEFDQVGSTMDDFLSQTSVYYKIKLDDPIIGCNLTNNNFNPEFSSGFFITNN